MLHLLPCDAALFTWLQVSLDWLPGWGLGFADYVSPVGPFLDARLGFLLKVTDR